jgi:antibiotic biosynthesis monooxygenase (ABM) superfamily enzyme
MKPTQYDLDYLTVTLVDAVQEYFKIPKVQEDYQSWLEKRHRSAIHQDV